MFMRKPSLSAFGTPEIGWLTKTPTAAASGAQIGALSAKFGARVRAPARHRASLRSDLPIDLQWKRPLADPSRVPEEAPWGRSHPLRSSGSAPVLAARKLWLGKTLVSAHGQQLG